MEINYYNGRLKYDQNELVRVKALKGTENSIEGIIYSDEENSTNVLDFIEKHLTNLCGFHVYLKPRSHSFIDSNDGITFIKIIYDMTVENYSSEIS